MYLQCWVRFGFNYVEWVLSDRWYLRCLFSRQQVLWWRVAAIGLYMLVWLLFSCRDRDGMRRHGSVVHDLQCW